MQRETGSAIKAMQERLRRAAEEKDKPTSAALERDKDLLNSAAHKGRFRKNKESIAKWSEEMSANTRRDLIKMLNIRHLLGEEATQVEEVVAPAAVNKQVKPMQVVPVSGMFMPASARLAKSMENAPEQSATFAEFFDFAHLCRAAVAHVPEGKEVTPELVTEKLEAFTRAATQFDIDALLKFIEDQKRYDELLMQLRRATLIDQPRLQGAFRSFQTEFVKLNNQLLPQIIDAVTNLSDLIAYLDNNLGVGVKVRQALQAEYEANGYSDIVQMKKTLVERCSPNLCVALDINSDNSESVIDIVKSILTNEALRLGNEANINKLVM